MALRHVALCHGTHVASLSVCTPRGLAGGGGRRGAARAGAEEVGSDPRTPHSGYHFDGSGRRFFEGWYLRVSLPEARQSFAWMYSVEDPGTPPAAAVGAQVLGPDDEYLWQYGRGAEAFWASRHELSLGHTFEARTPKGRPKGPTRPEEFSTLVKEGFQVTPTWHQGTLRDKGRSASSPSEEEEEAAVSWSYRTRAVYGWGAQRSTAGWLAAVPLAVFEPHWQVCMAAGLSSGTVRWRGRTYAFEDAPSYVEKNWGGSFPGKWFWVQCNVFEGVEGEMALTAGGGRRGLPLLQDAVEEVAMVGVHYKGRFYEFVPWKGEVSWKISPWGNWMISAKTTEYEVELIASTESPGTVLRAPTKDNGLAPFCRDTFFGNLELSIWECNKSGRRTKVVVQATSTMAALEVGGGPWWEPWENVSKISGPQSALLSLPLDVGSLLPPALRPPGL